MISSQADLFADPPLSTPNVDRRGKADTSRSAHTRVRSTAPTHERIVYEAIVAAGVRGATRKELAARLKFAENQQNRITGRVASLITRGVVLELEQLLRDGSHVLVAERYRNDLPVPQPRARHA